MNANYAAEVLERHNKWRRGDDELPPTDPKELTEAIDCVCAALKARGEPFGYVVENGRDEFFYTLSGAQEHQQDYGGNITPLYTAPQPESQPHSGLRAAVAELLAIADNMGDRRHELMEEAIKDLDARLMAMRAAISKESSLEGKLSLMKDQRAMEKIRAAWRKRMFALMDDGAVYACDPLEPHELDALLKPLGACSADQGPQPESQPTVSKTETARGVMEDHRDAIVIRAPDPLPEITVQPKTERQYTARANRRGKFKPRKRGR